MTAADAALLGALPGWAFAFVLLLARSSAAVMLLPGLGEAEPPAMVRAGLAVGITLLLLPVIAPLVPAAPPDVWRTAAMVVAELLAGGVLGWLARLIALALPIAGQMISYMTGLSSVLQPDATLGSQASALSRLFGITAPVLILGTGLYRLPLVALAGSYQLVAPGSLLPTADATQAGVAAVGQCFALAMRLSAPFLFANTIWQVGLGLLGRLVPQLQVHLASLPGQILGGLLLLALLGVGLLDAWMDTARAGLMLLPGI